MTDRLVARAVSAFERLTGLHVTLHDPDHAFIGCLPPERAWHSHPCCMRAKAHAQPACVRDDVVRVRAEVPRRGDGFLKVCHAGLLEWVVPIRVDGHLRAVLFAGVRRAGRGLLPAVADVHPQKPPAGLPVVDAAEAEDLLEAMRQLALRIATWDAQRRAVLPADATPRPADRRARITAFISRHHARPIGLDDIARHLRLSVDRARHEVVAQCGAPFTRLVVDARLATARALLEATDLSIAEVATRCGFSDMSHFHATFRERTGRTPGAWRRARDA